MSTLDDLVLRIVEDDGQTISAAQILGRIPGARMAQLSLSEVQLSVARLVRSGRLTDARNGWYGTAAAVRADNVSHAKAAPLTIASAFSIGRLVGQRYGGDPFKAARDWRLPIEYVDNLPVLARVVSYADGSAKIRLSTGRLAEHGRTSVAHELGHWRLSTADDKLADAFARGFLSAAA